MKFGILGPGNIANKMARTVNALEGMELYAVASRNYDGSVHDKKHGKNYKPNRDVKDALLKEGWDWYGNKITIVDIPTTYKEEFPMIPKKIKLESFPMIQNKPMISSNPLKDPSIDVEVFPVQEEQFYIETFPMEEVGTIILIIGIVYVGACIVGAFFTGGQSLWGLLAV